MTMWLSDTQKIGVGLTAFGLFFMLMGVMMFFDGGLLAIGNILFLSGLTLVIGTQKTLYFFARRQKIRGTVCFFGGILLVFIKWPKIGVLVELIGFINLFGDFFPVILGFLRRLPVIGNILSAPGIAKVVDRIVGQRLPV
ncbi:Golgi Transport [Gryganskiella cystojenkinii]|nr:Golgi Transport [Gryganskiella cystojenkinii]